MRSDLFNRIIIEFKSQNPYTNVVGLARTLLALSLLTTLVFNDTSLIFSAPGQPLLNEEMGVWKFSIYHFFGSKYFFVAKTISIIILLGVIAGIYPRLTGILHWWVSISFFLSSPYVDGGDQIGSILTFLLIPLTLLDNRKNHWGKSVYQNNISKIIGNINHKVIRLQVCIVYLHAAFAKLELTEWVNGTVIYYWFTHNTFGLNPYLEPVIIPLIANNYVVFFITWSVLILEIALFACIFSDRKWRIPMLYLGLIFHFLIFLVHGLGSFALAMAAALILYLYPIEKESQLERFITRFVRTAT